MITSQIDKPRANEYDNIKMLPKQRFKHCFNLAGGRGLI